MYVPLDDGYGGGPEGSYKTLSREPVVIYGIGWVNRREDAEWSATVPLPQTGAALPTAAIKDIFESMRGDVP